MSVAPLVTALGARHPVAVVDLPGHGGSPVTGETADGGPVRAASIDGFAADVLGVVEALQPGPCVVVGHSMGGLVALGCAGRLDLVAAAVLLDPAPILARRGKEFFERSVAEVAADADGSWRRRFVERLLPRIDVPGRAQVVETFVRFPPDLAAAECRALAEADGLAALQAVQVPILMITAGPPEREVVDHAPEVVLGRVVGSGHFVQLEVPDQVCAMIERFLDVSLPR